MKVDSSFFNTFLAAAKTLNFTDAARNLAMTQSGVSQHISKLEEQVGAPLFHRVGKKVFLTAIGQDLQKFIEHYQDSLLQFSEKVQNSTTSLRGLVRYAMPESCLLSPHFSLLLKEKAKAYPEIDLQVGLCSSDNVIEKVLQDEIDFGFSTHKIQNENLEFEEFCEEEYVLVSSLEISRGEKSKESLSHLIRYPGSGKIYDRWFSSQPKNKRDILVKGESCSNSLNAALVMVAHGLGCAVLPRHCVDTTPFKNKIKIHDEKYSTCLNQIYIVSLNSIFLPKRVEVIRRIFTEMSSKK